MDSMHSKEGALGDKLGTQQRTQVVVPHYLKLLVELLRTSGATRGFLHQVDCPKLAIELGNLKNAGDLFDVMKKNGTDCSYSAIFNRSLELDIAMEKFNRTLSLDPLAALRSLKGMRKDFELSVKPHVVYSPHCIAMIFSRSEIDQIVDTAVKACGICCESLVDPRLSHHVIISDKDIDTALHEMRHSLLHLFHSKTLPIITNEGFTSGSNTEFEYNLEQYRSSILMTGWHELFANQLLVPERLTQQASTPFANHLAVSIVRSIGESDLAPAEQGRRQVLVIDACSSSYRELRAFGELHDDIGNHFSKAGLLMEWMALGIVGSPFNPSPLEELKLQFPDIDEERIKGSKQVVEMLETLQDFARNNGVIPSEAIGFLRQLPGYRYFGEVEQLPILINLYAALESSTDAQNAVGISLLKILRDPSNIIELPVIKNIPQIVNGESIYHDLMWIGYLNTTYGLGVSAAKV